MAMINEKEYSGHLFVLEGIDGAGKTTVGDQVVRSLTEHSYDTVRLREPTSESTWGQEIRLRSPKGELTSTEELDLFIRDRDWHVQNKILPALREGKVVLMDRYFFATGAYQSGSTGIPWPESPGCPPAGRRRTGRRRPLRPGR